MPRDKHGNSFGINSVVQPDAFVVEGFLVSRYPVDLEAIAEVIDPDGEMTFARTSQLTVIDPENDLYAEYHRDDTDTCLVDVRQLESGGKYFPEMETDGDKCVWGT